MRTVLRRYRNFILYALAAVMVMQAIAAYYFTLKWFHPRVIFWGPGNIVLFGLYATLVVFFTVSYGSYRIGNARMRELTLSYGISICIANAITYFQICLIEGKPVTPLPMMVLSVAQTVVAMLLIILMTRIYFRLFPRERVIVIANSQAPTTALLRGGPARYCGYEVVAFAPAHLDYEALAQAIEPYSGVVLGDMSASTRAYLFDCCYRADKHIYILPNVMDVVVRHSEDVFSRDLLLYSCKGGAFSLEYRFVKRAMDIVVSAVAMVVFLPLMLILSLVIRLSDGGPAIYRQVRLTRDGRRFTLYKFRSMRPDAEKESGARLASKNDTRVTRVGRFLRRLRLDELPQLFNILIGDMTLVGPRPERPELFERIVQDYPPFAYRLKVKAGLTGYAQLYGKYNTSFEDKALLDLQYIESASIAQDLRLMLYTLKILLLKDSTEGVDFAPPVMPSDERDGENPAEEMKKHA